MHNLFIFDKSKTVFLKAVLPILILFHHLNGVTKLEYLRPFGVVGIAVVSLFFFISGYGLLASFQKKGMQYLYDFLRQRILPIFSTYIGALALYLLFRTIIYSGTICEYLKVTNFTDWLPYSWFVLELLIMYFLYWGVFIIKSISVKCKVTISVFIIFVGYMLMICLDAPIYLWRSTPAFALGMLYRVYEDTVLNCKRRTMIFCIIMAFVLFIIANVLALKELNFLFICVMAFGAFSLFSIKNNRVIIFFNRISFEIYLVQSIAIGLVSLLPLSKTYLFCFLVVVVDIGLAVALNRYSVYMKKMVT